MAAIGATQHAYHWQALLDSAGEGIWGLDLEGTCTFVNQMATRTFGFSAEEMVGSNMHRLVHHTRTDGTPYPDEECSVYAILRGSDPFREQLETMFRKDGTPFLAEMSAQPVYVNGSLVGVVATFRDVTDLHRERAELDRAYKEAEKRTAELQAVIESIPHGVFVATLDGGPVRLNRRARALAGDNAQEPPKALALALAGESSNDVIEQNGRWLRSTGAPILLNDELIGGVAVTSDITQMRLQDEALRKAEKLAAVGQLASSIAHEINNPLEAITNLLYLIRQSGTIDEVQEYAATAQAELARVTEITMQTLRFHRQPSRPTLVDLGELTRAVMSLYTGRLLVRSITVSWKLLTAPKVLCLEGELRQVLNNLVRNALDAMSSGGRLSLRLHTQTVWTKGKDGEVAQKGVRLTVADTGEGISPKIAGRLFEPFQTTKETTGTGLGLWVSRGIVEKHGGRVRVRSRTGEQHGTVFGVWLPLEASFTRTSQTTG